MLQLKRKSYSYSKSVCCKLNVNITFIFSRFSFHSSKERLCSPSCLSKGLEGSNRALLPSIKAVKTAARQESCWDWEPPSQPCTCSPPQPLYTIPPCHTPEVRGCRVDGCEVGVKGVFQEGDFTETGTHPQLTVLLSIVCPPNERCDLCMCVCVCVHEHTPLGSNLQSHNNMSKVNLWPW